MATENTGGWQLTTSTYAAGRPDAGGRRRRQGHRDPQQRRDQGGPRSASRRCAGRTTRMGSTFDYAWGTMNQAFASGQVGMFTGGSDLYTWMIQNAALKPDDYGVTTIPLEGAERRRPRRRHPRRGQRRHRRGRARRGRQLDRLLLHPEAAHPGGRRGRRQGPQRQQPAGRRAGPADLRQGDLRRVPGLDQGLHQRPDGPDDAVHVEDLRPARSSTSRPPTPRSSTRPSTPSCRPC